MQMASMLASAGYSTDLSDAGATRSARSVEYDLFSRVTARLSHAAKTKSSDFPKLVKALHDNRRLWTAITTDVLLPDNALPDDLRAQLVSLNAFVQTHSGKILRDNASVRPLIEINLSILRGLRATGGTT